MGELRDGIDAIRVRASSSDGAVSAELSGRTRVTLSVEPGWYRRCTERDLERRLAALAERLWAARTREYWRVLSRNADQPITGEPRPIGTRAVAYRAARDALVARGRSADGRVSVAVEGMRRWTVHVQPGTVRALDEAGFAAAAGAAAADLIRDQYRKIAVLKREVYG